MFVHVSSTGDSVLLAICDDSSQFILVTHINFSDVFDITTLFVLSDLEVVFAYVKKVSYFLHIQLEYR